jgi:general secretion pathway protein I
LCRATFSKGTRREGSRRAGTRREGSQAGFTMIEAVVALALVTIMLASIGSLVAAATNGTRTLEGHVALVETARLVMTSIPRRGELQIDDLAGELSGHRWQVRLSPFLDDGQVGPGARWIPQNVAVRVQSPSGAIFTLETVRLARRPGS